ncbi:hypothetical protein POVCU2_0031680 [Plasmodium ovale curtisi]|uniref:Uncharacterized protein n=1 Tax=Plasmodium ovale curtisi TaxID=864141 RepID=A0A1A8WQD1_PLAOA|nr:hypothetical protein POVCU2_0031680 [Plasmodium ovale curtisi]SBS95100.1 hypothetical protein POVCU1_029120 [Plasmodium ovale curtisi]
MQEAKQARASLVQIEKGHQDKFQCCFHYIFYHKHNCICNYHSTFFFFSDITRKEDTGEEPNWDYKHRTTPYFCIPSIKENKRE